jgi:hypothetical protein
MKALIALFAAALCTTAVADDQYSKKDKAKDEHSMHSVEAKFDALDRNGDKQLSATEVRSESKLSSQFASLDLNTDGFVSKEEFVSKMDDKTWEKTR